MAKPFYSIDEVCNLLKRDAEGVKELVREGKLREFRDAGKVFFKAEDVEKLTGGSAGDIGLESVEELPSLLDIKEGTSVIGLAPVEDEPDRKDKKSGTVLSSAGIGVFDEDELEIEADPMADTQITSAAAPPAAKNKSEGTGSGSGLLDLTRESDDTSLGAELLDEIYPGEEEAPAAPSRSAPAAVEEVAEEPAGEEAEAAAPVYEPVLGPVIVSGDPSEGLFSGLLVGAAILLAVAASVVAGLLQGFVPDYAKVFSNNFWFFVGGSVALMGLTLMIGWLVGRSGTAPVRR